MKPSSPSVAPATLAARLDRTNRALVIGIGGGGDAVGCLALTHALDEREIEWVVGGVAWERFAVDPFPGPRPLADLSGAKRIAEHAALIDPERGATTPQGIHLCESRLASHLGRPTVLIDVTRGPSAAARGIAAAAGELECELVLLVDIGGDAIATGSEPGLASPLCDAVMIAAGVALDPALDSVLGVLGAGCDGELRPVEVLARVAALAETGAWLDTIGVTAGAAARIEAAAEFAVTEASRLVARCARGEHGTVEIRGGRRQVELSPVGALCFMFDVALACSALPLARAVAGTESIDAGRDALAAIGVRSELDYERDRAAGRD